MDGKPNIIISGKMNRLPDIGINMKVIRESGKLASYTAVIASSSHSICTETAKNRIKSLVDSLCGTITQIFSLNFLITKSEQMLIHITCRVLVFRLSLAIYQG